MTGICDSFMVDYSAVYALVQIQHKKTMIGGPVTNRIFNKRNTNSFVNSDAQIDWFGFGDTIFNVNSFSDLLIRQLCEQRDICFPLRFYS